MFQEYDLLERLVLVLVCAVLVKIIDLILIRSLRKVANTQ